MLIVFTVVIEKDGEDRNKEGEMHGKDKRFKDKNRRSKKIG